MSSADTVKPRVENEPAFCINYDEANSWDEVAEKYDYDFYSYSHKSKNYLEGKTQLTDQQAKRFLIGGDGAVDITNIWSDEVVSTADADEYLANSDFYLTHTIAGKPHWTALIIEKIEANGSETFLVTIDTNKRPVSKIRIAFYIRSGTYTADNGTRRPWFATKRACLYDHLIIKTDNNQGGLKTYAIDANGHIAQIK